MFPFTTSTLAQASDQACNNTELRDTYELVLKKKRYAANMLKNTEDLHTYLNENATSAANVNRASRTLFFTSLGLLASSGVALKYAITVSKVKYYGYANWLSRYYISTGVHPSIAAYGSRLVPELSIWPGLLAMTVGSAMATFDPTKNQKFIREYAERMKYKPTREESIRLTMALSTADINTIVSKFLNNMVDNPEAEMNKKSEELISRFRNRSNGLFGGNGADYTQALASTQLAKSDLYKFQVSVLSDLEHDMSVVCSHL